MHDVGAAIRFVVAGAGNTLVTGALLSLLALWLDVAVAYTIVFLAGIVLSTYLAGAFVFKGQFTPTRVAMHVVMYVAVYLLGLACLSWLTATGLPRHASGLIVLVTAPLTFLGGRLIFQGRKQTDGTRQGFQNEGR